MNGRVPSLECLFSAILLLLSYRAYFLVFEFFQDQRKNDEYKAKGMTELCMGNSVFVVLTLHISPDFPRVWFIMDANLHSDICNTFWQKYNTQFFKGNYGAKYWGIKSFTNLSKDLTLDRFLSVNEKGSIPSLTSNFMRWHRFLFYQGTGLQDFLYSGNL